MSKKEERKERVVELYDLGVRTEEIAKKLDISIGTTIRYVKQLKKEGRIQSRKLIESIDKKENKEKTAKLYNSGVKIREIAENIGVSVGTINRYIKELKEEGKVRVINKEEVEKRILELYNQGVEIKEIAESLKIPVGTINIYTKKLRKEGIIQSRKIIKSIEMEETKERILKLYNQGIKIEEIAKKLDLSDSTVYRAIRKLNDERMSHVTINKYMDRL